MYEAGRMGRKIMDRATFYGLGNSVGADPRVVSALASQVQNLLQQVAQLTKRIQILEEDARRKTRFVKDSLSSMSALADFTQELAANIAPSQSDQPARAAPTYTSRPNPRVFLPRALPSGSGFPRAPQDSTGAADGLVQDDVTSPVAEYEASEADDQSF